MMHAKNYQKLYKFVKVTANILSFFFSGHRVLFKQTQLSLDFLKVQDAQKQKLIWNAVVTSVMMPHVERNQDDPKLTAILDG